MRTFAILSLFILVSCASPQKNPESYYAGTYAPSYLNIENGEFVAYASVVEKDDVKMAEKAAYLRLMKDGKEKGYRYFQVTDAGEVTLIGTRYTIKGKLYKSNRNGSNIFSLDAISRLLRGLPLKQEYVAPKPKKKITKAISKKVAPKPVSVAPTPVPAPTPVAVDPNGPTIIMAPEDITGSVQRKKIHLPKNVNGTEPVGHFTQSVDLPNAVSDIPTGVLLRKKY